MVVVCGKPILEHTILALKEHGITNIILVVSSNSSIISYFGNGKKCGVHIDYCVQKQPLGMGDALISARDKINGDFLVMNASHVGASIFLPKLLSAKKDNDGVLLTQKREETWKYGVIESKDEKVVSVIEKPQKGKEPSKLCIVGIYLLEKSFLTELEQTPPHQYQFEDALSSFAKKYSLIHIETKEKLTTLKYPWDIFTIKDFLLSQQKSRQASNISFAQSSEISGNVVLEKGVKIMEKAIIKGPCFIGKNVTIGNHAIVRSGTCLEEGSVVGARMEIKNTILMKHATTHSGFIGDSVIGENCKIAAGFITANVRLDREEVKSVVKGEKVTTGRKSLGVIMGTGVRVGIKCSTMPGVIVGNNVVIGPSTTVAKNVSDDVTYYTKTAETIEKV